MALASPAPVSYRAVTRILIADDNAIVRSVMHTLIETRPGLQVCGEAASGLEAIQQAKELQPDLVVLDLRMPGMNGLQAAPIIKQALPNARVVLCTMLENEISESLRLAAKIDMVVRKPDGLDSLVKAISDLVHPTWL